MALAGCGVVAVAVWAMLPGGDEGPQVDMLVHRIVRGEFRHEVSEPGEVGSASNVEIRCEVKSRGASSSIQILKVVPEGTIVESGDPLVWLNSSTLEQEKLQQEIVCNTSKAVMIQAKSGYETAQIAEKEYINGIFKQEEQTILGEIFVAQETLRRAEEYYRYSQTLSAKGFQTSLQLEADRFAVEKAQTELATARTRLSVLREYTKPKMEKELQSDIVSKQARWEAESRSHELDNDKFEDYSLQIKNCVVRAPQSGQVVYANERSRRGGTDVVIEPGLMVREGQVLIRLPDPNLMQVKAKVNESQIALVDIGMKVEITLDAFPNEKLHGEVTKVNEYPEPTNWRNESLRVYATFVRITNSPEHIKLKPGLTAQVSITVDTQSDVLQIPVQAVKEYKERYFCAVRSESGWQMREIAKGATNDRFVIAEGVRDGETVSLNPDHYLDSSEMKDYVAAKGPLITKNLKLARIAKKKPPASGGKAAGLFKRYDKDKDNRLTKQEMPSHLLPMFKRFDANSDGAVDLGELKLAFARLKQRAAARPGNGRSESGRSESGRQSTGVSGGG